MAQPELEEFEHRLGQLIEDYDDHLDSIDMEIALDRVSQHIREDREATGVPR